MRHSPIMMFGTDAEVPDQSEGRVPATIPVDAYEALSPEEKQEADYDLFFANMIVSYYWATKSSPPIRSEWDDALWIGVLRDLINYAAQSWSYRFLALRGTLCFLQNLWPDRSIPCPIEYSLGKIVLYPSIHMATHQEFFQNRQKLCNDLGASFEGLVPYDKYETAKAASAKLEKEWDAKANHGEYPLRDGRWSLWLT